MRRPCATPTDRGVAGRRPDVEVLHCGSNDGIVEYPTNRKVLRDSEGVRAIQYVNGDFVENHYVATTNGLAIEAAETFTDTDQVERFDALMG